MRYLLVLICFVAGMSACTTSPVTPTRTSRQTIDTIYNRKVILLQPEIDSVCAVVRNAIFQPAVDSIMAMRKSEMTNLVQ